jgi:hypothetical protein
MHEVVAYDGGTRTRVGDGGAYPAARRIETVAPFLPVLPSLGDAHIPQIGAVGEEVVLSRVSCDVFLVKGDVV